MIHVNKLVALSLILLLLCPTTAWAEDKPKVVEITKGEPAPFDGVILNGPAYDKIITMMGDLSIEKKKSAEWKRGVKAKRKASLGRDAGIAMIGVSVGIVLSFVLIIVIATQTDVMKK